MSPSLFNAAAAGSVRANLRVLRRARGRVGSASTSTGVWLVGEIEAPWGILRERSASQSHTRRFRRREASRYTARSSPSTSKSEPDSESTSKSNSKSGHRERSWWQTPHFVFTAKMSGAGGAGIVAAAAAAAMYVVVSTPAVAGARPEDADAKAHHLEDGKGFINPWDSFRDFVGWKMGLRLLWRKLSGQMKKVDTTPPTVPVVTPTFRSPRAGGKLRATWLGHACYYVEFPSGLRVLFDPVFEACCAPVNLKTFERFTPPPCEIEDLPAVDLVVISHNHYDHLSYPTIKRIQKAFPKAHFFAPLGNKRWFVDSGVQQSQVTELDWWEERDVRLSPTSHADIDTKERTPDAVPTNETSPDGTPAMPSDADITATISALPCQHVSARGPFDKCKTLWASWSLASAGATVYFAGDTGYRSVPESTPEGDDGYGPGYAALPVCPAFAHIGRHRGPFDLGFIPIGAYEPRWVMSPMHANPQDSVAIFVDTRCVRALGMHWGTWVLTEEDVMEPPRKLGEALRARGLSGDAFGVVDIGESREFESGGDARGVEM
ncbi:hypothetical protein PMIN02_012499 [Paraphaeosphaeria minitans]